MVNLSIKFVCDNHTHAWQGYKFSTGSGICARSQSTPTVLENRGFSNHTTSHTWNFTIDAQIGDRIVASSWTYLYSNTKNLKLYVNGVKRIDTTLNAQCHSADYTFTGEDFIVGGRRGTPTYLETLDKMDQWSSAQYVPDGLMG